MMKILVKNNTEEKTLFVDAYRLPQLRFNVFQYKIASKLTSAMISEAGNHFAKQIMIFLMTVFHCIVEFFSVRLVLISFSGMIFLQL